MSMVRSRSMMPPSLRILLNQLFGMHEERHNRLRKTSPNNKDYSAVLKAALAEQSGPVVNEAIQKQTAGDFAGAIELYKKAIATTPDDATLYTNVASAYQQAEDFNNAKMAFRKALTLD